RRALRRAGGPPAGGRVEPLVRRLPVGGPVQPGADAPGRPLPHLPFPVGPHPCRLASHSSSACSPAATRRGPRRRTSAAPTARRGAGPPRPPRRDAQGLAAAGIPVGHARAEPRAELHVLPRGRTGRRRPPPAVRGLPERGRPDAPPAVAVRCGRPPRLVGRLL